MSKEKACRSCSEIKNLSNFNRDKKTPDGYDYHAKIAEKLKKENGEKKIQNMFLIMTSNTI